MKALIQRVKNASVSIDNQLYSEINAGILVFLGVTKDDTIENSEKLAQKVLSLRIFEDENEKMNFSIKDVNGEILVVSQFTLCGDCKKGTRPSFDNAAHPDVALKLYEDFLKIECNENWWNEDMNIKQLEKYFNRAESSIRKAIKKMCDNGFSNYKYLDNNKVIISRKGVEWICKNAFKQKYLELLEKYKMELTELYIKAGYPYDHFFHKN